MGTAVKVGLTPKPRHTAHGRVEHAGVGKGSGADLGEGELAMEFG